MASQEQRARDLYAVLQADIGDYPHWTVKDIAKCLNDGISDAVMTAEYQLVFDVYNENWGRAQGLLKKLRQEYGKRIDVTVDKVLYWINQNWTDEEVVAEYRKETIEEPLERAAKELLAQMRQEHGIEPSYTEGRVLGYMHRGFTRLLIVDKYMCAMEQRRLLARAKDLRELVKEETGNGLDVSDVTLTVEFREGKTDDELVMKYRRKED